MSGNRERLVLAAWVAALVSLVFWPALRLFFHLDDFSWLHAAWAAQSTPGFRLPADVNGHFRPLVEAYWLVAYRWFGLHAGAHYLTALAIHGLTAVAVGCMTRRVDGSRAAAVCAATYFAIGFAHRSVPLWLSAAPDRLLGLGAAMGVAALVHRRHRAAVLWLLVAMTAKETGLMLVPIVALLAPGFVRTRWSLVLGSATVALAVPHALAFVLSPYASGRFQLGWHVVANFLRAASALLAPWPGQAPAAIADWVSAESVARQSVGLGLLITVTLLAARRLGLLRALAWLAAALLALLPATLSTDAIEPRWLYLPWVFVAPLAASATVVVARLVGRGHRRVEAGLMILALVGHVVVHGAALRARIDRSEVRDRWTRGLIEGAMAGPPSLWDGQRVEVVVPAAADLRFWPLGLAVAVDRGILIVPIEAPGGDIPNCPRPVTLDASAAPARWLRHACD